MKVENIFKLLFVLVIAFGLTLGCSEESDDDDNNNGTNPPTNTIPDAVDGIWYLLAASEVDEEAVVNMFDSNLILQLDKNEKEWTLYENLSPIQYGPLAYKEDGGRKYLTFELDFGATVRVDGEILVNNDFMLKIMAPKFDEEMPQEKWILFKGGNLLAGLVNDSDTEMPVAGAQVEINLANLGNNQYTVQTDADGIFYQDDCTLSYDIVVTAEGYRTAMVSGATPVADTPFFLIYPMEAEVQQTTGTIAGLINDQTTMIEPSVPVTVSAGGVSVVSSDGTYILREVPVGTVTLTATAEGYENYSTEITVEEGNNVKNINLVPGQSSTSNYMIKMYWNETSTADLDLGLVTPEINGVVYTISPVHSDGTLLSAPFVKNDVDWTDGPGPETLEFSQMVSGTYKVFGRRWSGEFGSESAFVQFFDENETLVETVNAPSGDSSYWHVANIDGATGQVTVINELVSTIPGVMNKTSK